VNTGLVEVQLIEPPHYSIFAGVPIFEQVQDFFEDLWNWISQAANAAAVWLLGALGDFLGRWNPETGRIEGGLFGWIWNSLAGVASGIGGFIGGLWNAIQDAFGWISDVIWSWVGGALKWLSDTFLWIAGQLSAAAGWIVDSLKGALAGVGDLIGPAVQGFFDWIWGGIQAVGTAVSDGVGWVAGQVKTMFDGAVSTIGEWLTGAANAIAEGFGNVFRAIWDWLCAEVPKFLASAASFINEYIVQPILGALNWVFERLKDAVQWLIDSITALFTGHSPIGPEDALALGVGSIALAVVGGGLTTAIVDIVSTKIVGTGLDLKSLGGFIVEAINPSMFIGAVLGVIVGVGIRTPLTQFYRKTFRPEIPDISTATRMLWRGSISEEQYADIVARHGYGNPWEAAYMELTKQIPGVGDLVTMVVREAFDPKMVVEAPEIFAEYLSKTGYSKEWADRYWTAHFEPIALAQAYANLWRGFWTKEDFFRSLLIADVHPNWWEDIYNVAFRPPGARELGYGYDTGLYSVEDIKQYRKMGGLSDEDAEKAAIALVAYRTEAEREALRREALADFEAGLDTEEILRGKLAAIGTRPEVIDLWAARANYRVERDMKLDLVKVAKDLYVKGLLSDVELRGELEALGVVRERIEIHIAEAETRRATTAKAATAEKQRNLTEAKIGKAWELGLLSDEEYVSRLLERNYTEEDAQLLLEILRTPLPLTAEEAERRQKSITAKINRVRRRYDLLILSLDAQITLISDEIEAIGATQKEVLDVYDTELSYLRAELAAAPPGGEPEIEKRIALITERRDVAVARYQERSIKLRDNLAAAADRRTELLKMRDAELSELESELRTVGAVAA